MTAHYCNNSANINTQNAFNSQTISHTKDVGYQNKSLDPNYNYVANSFLGIGKTKATMTFGDIAVNENLMYMGTIIQLLTDTGATATITDCEELGEVDAMFTYVRTSDGAAIEGWYLMDDYGFEYPQNARILPAGQGILVDCGDADAALIFAGEVDATDTEVMLQPNYNFTGNCSPADITFGDIAVNENLMYMGTIIQLLTDTGATATITDCEELGEVDAMFTYVRTSDGAAVEGWYLMDDYGFEYPQNARILPACQGILVDCGDADASIVIPSALK